MATLEISGAMVHYPDNMASEEAIQYFNDEENYWKANNPLKTLGKVVILLDGDDVLITSESREPIKRIRRITGYQSNIENWNPAKTAELAARRSNFGIREK